MKNATDITIILDRSGSMSKIKEATISGVNAFLEEQKANKSNEAFITLVQFDNEYDVVYAGKPIVEVPELTNATFVPRGDTALCDAIGRTIEAVGARLSALPEDQRPSQVILSIVTDGNENASKEYTSQRIHEMISHQEGVYSWQFLFLGANQDSIKTGESFGIKTSHSVNYNATANGARAMFTSMSAKLGAVRSSGSFQSLDYNDQDRKILQDEK